MTKRLPLLLTASMLPLLLMGTLMIAAQIRAGSYDICSTCPYPSIQTAVNDDSNVGQTLTIGPGTFPETVEITRSITLIGAGSGQTIIDGQAADTVILINNGPIVSISGVTIQNGDTTSDDGGGGLLNQDGTINLTNVVVQNNTAKFGAGIANNGTMTLDNVIVRNNTADEIIATVSVCGNCTGGGILNSDVMTIISTTVHDNTANFGGGIDNEGTLVASNVNVYNNSVSNNPGDPDAAGGGIENRSTMTLTNSVVRNNNAPLGAGIYNESNLTVVGGNLYSNMATIRGGGIHNLSDLTVQTSNIYENEAGSGGGGGISSEGGDVIVAGTAVYNNSASANGGGIVHNVTAGNNSFAIINSTISGNSTSGTGGGLRNAGMANTTLNNVTLSNNSSIVAAGQSVSVVGGTLSAKNSLINGPNLGGSRTNCSGTISSNGYNIANDSSCGLNSTGDLPNTNPRLGSLQSNGGGTLTHALLIGSPAIDSGSSSDCPAVDQRGVARPFGAECDRGAYEFDVVTQSVYLPFVIRP